MKLMNVIFLFSCSLILTQIHGMEPTERQVPSLKELCVRFANQSLQNNNNALQNVMLTNDAYDQLARDFMSHNAQLRHFILAIMLSNLYADGRDMEVTKDDLFEPDDYYRDTPIDTQINVMTPMPTDETILNSLNYGIFLNEKSKKMMCIINGWASGVFTAKAWDIDNDAIKYAADVAAANAVKKMDINPLFCQIQVINPLFFEVNDILKNGITYDQTQLLDVIYQANQANGLPVLNTINQVTLNQAGQAAFDALPDVLYCLLEPYVIQNQQ